MEKLLTILANGVLKEIPAALRKLNEGDKDMPYHVACNTVLVKDYYNTLLVKHV